MCVIDILLSLFWKKTCLGRKNITYLKLDLPTINAPATQMSTVNEVLNQSLSIMRGLGLTKIVCVFNQDQAWPISHHLHTAGNNRKAFPRCWTPRPVHAVWHDRGRPCCCCHGGPQVQQGSATKQAPVWGSHATDMERFPLLVGNNSHEQHGSCRVGRQRTSSVLTPLGP